MSKTCTQKTYEDGYREGFKDGFDAAQKSAGYDLAPPHQRWPVPAALPWVGTPAPDAAPPSAPNPFYTITIGPRSASMIAKPDPNIQSWG